MKRGKDKERGRVFLVRIKQLSGLGMSIPKLWTVYFVHSAVVLCEITSALSTCKITGPRHVMFNKIININHIITKFATVDPSTCTCMIMCTTFGKKCTTFAEITLQNWMNQSSLTRECLMIALYLVQCRPTYANIIHISNAYLSRYPTASCQSPERTRTCGFLLSEPHCGSVLPLWPHLPPPFLNLSKSYKKLFSNKSKATS